MPPENRQMFIDFGDCRSEEHRQTSLGVSCESIAEISLGLKKSWPSRKRDWEGSPFEWIANARPATAGAIGVAIVSEWARSIGFRVGKSRDKEADMTIESKRAEVKLSTAWASGEYKFQQLRDQNYDFAVCLGLSPRSSHCWVIPKKDLMRLWKKDGEIRGQHCGGNRDGDTAWLSVHPATPQPWILKYGGSMEDASSCLRRAVMECR